MDSATIPHILGLHAASSQWVLRSVTGTSRASRALMGQGEIGVVDFLMAGARQAFKVKVEAAFDSDAGVYYIVNSNVPGLRTEGKTVDELLQKIGARLPDLLELNAVPGKRKRQPSLPIELTTTSELALA